MGIIGKKLIIWKKFACAIYGGSEPGVPRNNHPRGVPRAAVISRTPGSSGRYPTTLKNSHTSSVVSTFEHTSLALVLSTSNFHTLLVPGTLGVLFKSWLVWNRHIIYIPGGYMGRYIVGVQYLIPGMKLVYQMVHGYTHLVRFLATHVDSWYQFWDPAHVIGILKPFLGEGHYQTQAQLRSALPCVCPYSSKALTLELYLSLNIVQN